MLFSFQQNEGTGPLFGLFPETGNQTPNSVLGRCCTFCSARHDFGYLICKSMLCKVLHCNAEAQPPIPADTECPKTLFHHLGKESLSERWQTAFPSAPEEGLELQLAEQGNPIYFNAKIFQEGRKPSRGRLSGICCFVSRSLVLI